VNKQAKGIQIKKSTSSSGRWNNEIPVTYFGLNPHTPNRVNQESHIMKKKAVTAIAGEANLNL
jgi:hypothetical protein